MLIPQSSKEAPERAIPVPAEYRDIVHSRGPCSVAVLRMIGLRPIRRRVALAELPWLHQHVLAEEINQRATPLATFYNALNSSANQGFHAFSELTHHTPVSTRTLPIAITFFLEDENRIADVPSGDTGVGPARAARRRPDHPYQLVVRNHQSQSGGGVREPEHNPGPTAARSRGD
ncbi:hypothetical protein BQ8482_850007 [Mesorhizobium delmotii]|uniref:Uncharacterized protein n=1 Tax=Mesorhizobium delmotii TaxID=1631247 RepID=A0A2P9AWW3_9HYPH|nr:hypothetical protein BQ8482_850007 [Mesorhizobium delmotii]